MSEQRHHYHGKECLDIHLLKPSRAWAEVATDHVDGQVVDAGALEHAQDGEWVTYKYREAHPILRWLPSKLAEWIGDNYGSELGIPQRRNADGWTVGELNSILENNLVAGTTGHLRTFGCIQWENEVYIGRPKARCYPFDMPKHRFRGANPQVLACAILALCTKESIRVLTEESSSHIVFVLQDCVCLIAPQPYNPNPIEAFKLDSDFDMSGSNLLWYGKLQLLFRCTLCPKGASRDIRCHKEVSLAFFSTFEPIDLTPFSVLQRQGVPMLYDSASSAAIPFLYICHCKNILGRVPLIPCFVAGNSHPTIPHSYSRQINQTAALADSRNNSGNGSRLYEVNVWMWRYGRGQARKETVLEAMVARAKRVREARARAGETRKRRRTSSHADVDDGS